MDNVETIALNKVQALGGAQAAAGEQFYLAFDKTGNVASILNYSGTLVDFDREVLKVQTGA